MWAMTTNSNNSSKQTSFMNKQTKMAARLVAAGIVLLAIVVWVWWHFVYSGTNRVFFGAVENSLRTTSVSKLVTQSSAGQSLEQKLEITTGPNHLVRGQTTITENFQGDTTIKTTAIGSPKVDYVSYSSIDTNQKTKSGKNLDFSNIIGVWGKNQPANKLLTTGELYSEAVLGAVPIGSLPAQERSEVMNFIQKNSVYEFDKSKVSKKLQNGRPVYGYDVTVKPEYYVGMLKSFARSAGLTQLDNIDPKNYKDSPPIKVKINVDVWSHQISSIGYSEGRHEQLGSYGVVRNIQTPEKTISLEKLQKRLQSIQ